MCINLKQLKSNQVLEMMEIMNLHVFALLVNGT